MDHASASVRYAPSSAFVIFLLTALLYLLAMPVLAQSVDQDLLDEAVRRTGRSREDLLQEYQRGATTAPDTVTTPGRRSLAGVDDRRTRSGQDPTGGSFGVVLPSGAAAPAEIDADSLALSQTATAPAWFGHDVFVRDGTTFEPPSFGPVPADYLLGVGDEVVVDVWGDVEMRLVRVVDRDGSVILPEAGRVAAAGRSLAAVDQALRQGLAARHASIGRDADDTRATTFVRVTLGRLRPIRVYVVGEVARPGSYELNSVSTVLTALYAAGGPAQDGSLRQVRLVRAGLEAAAVDLYDYLLAGDRAGDALLREGDTIHVPGRRIGVRIGGAVRRPLGYEMLPGETVTDLIRFAGGLRAGASPGLVHVQRILPPADRRPGEPDVVAVDVALDPTTLVPRQPELAELHDGDMVTVDAISDRAGNRVTVRGLVERPGTYELRPGMTVTDLVRQAGGLWPDALTEWATLDRTSPDLELTSVSVALGRVLAGQEPPVALRDRDVLHIYSRGAERDRPRVHITGEVHQPLSLLHRQGMTLRDLVLRAGGLKPGADPLHAEISRTSRRVVMDPDPQAVPQATVEVIRVELGEDFLALADSPALEPWDRVAIRRLPWWESQRTVTVAGEVFYPGVFSLTSAGETLSSVLVRAGGLKPSAYATGARVVRERDHVGNVAIDLARALDEPDSQHDIILEPGDRVIVPNRMYTVRVTGEVGFPTSLVWEEGRKIDYYVERAGGYLEHGDKGRTRVVHPNGMSLPNKGSSKVVAGSTIVVPLEPPPEGRTTLEVAKDVTSILAGVATIWLIVDR
ncbi:MAG: hypothetical protein GY838_08885 [bacterium]|nr:hypothetical protein [bacterium]